MPADLDPNQLPAGLREVPRQVSRGGAAAHPVGRHRRTANRLPARAVRPGPQLVTDRQGARGTRRHRRAQHPRRPPGPRPVAVVAGVLLRGVCRGRRRHAARHRRRDAVGARGSLARRQGRDAARADQHPELVSRPGRRRHRAEGATASLERFSGYIEEMQRAAARRAGQPRRCRARFEEPNRRGARRSCSRTCAATVDSWRWQANLELFAGDAAKGTGSVIAAWPDLPAGLRPYPGPVAVGRRGRSRPTSPTRTFPRCARCSRRCGS